MLTLAGVDRADRQCVVAPSAREPVTKRTIIAGPVAQRRGPSPLEVYGATSPQVNDVRIAYRLGSERLTTFATMLRITDREALRRAGIARPFGYYFAELPPRARVRRVIAIAVVRRNRELARDDYRNFHDLPRSVVIATGPAASLPTPRVRRRVGRFAHVRVPVEIGRYLGVRDGLRHSYLVTTSSAHRQTACVNQRQAAIGVGKLGTTTTAVLDVRNGEGGPEGYCPGPYLGTVVYVQAPACPARGPCDNTSSVSRQAELVARFSYRVR